MRNCNTCIHLEVCRIRHGIKLASATFSADEVDITCKHYKPEETKTRKAKK